MQADDIIVGPDLARVLVSAQFPDLAHLAIAGAVSGGTDNVIWRLGDDLALRFPRRAAAEAGFETRWLPALAPGLPLAVPAPLRHGSASANYPLRWTISPWLAGRDALAAPPDQLQAAADLADFVRALRGRPAPPDAPAMRPKGHLAPRDAFMREMIAAFRPAEGDRGRLTAIWEECLALPVWSGPPVWIHADLHPLNILTRAGRITAVLDWGEAAAGDPAQDLMPGWTLLDGPARAEFRARLAPDAATWARGRALAFSKAVQAVPWYRTSNPAFRDAMAATLRRCLEDWP